MLFRVIRDISVYFHRYAFDAVVVGILGMLLYGCIFLFKDSKKTTLLNQLGQYIGKRLPQYITSFFLFAYLYIMISIALLSRREKYIDKIDFSFWGAGLSTRMSQVFFVENIIMFFPLGLFLPICFKKANKPHAILIAGFLASLLIEITQFLAKWGRFEIVDLWTNTLGALLGWMLYQFIRFISMIVYKNVHKEKYK